MPYKVSWDEDVTDGRLQPDCHTRAASVIPTEERLSAIGYLEELIGDRGLQISYAGESFSARSHNESNYPVFFGVGLPTTISDRFMSMFAQQDLDNTVTGIDAQGLVQRLLLFDHYILASVWLKDVQLLLRIVDPDALCELLDGGAMSFHIDTAMAAEIGQARNNLDLTGNTSRLEDHEFNFATIKGKDDVEKTRKALDELSKTDGISSTKARKVAERVEGLMLKPKGLAILSEAYKGFYEELRSPQASALSDIVAWKLQGLGAKPEDLRLSIEEFVLEDFRVHSNLTTRFGLSSQSARRIVLKSLLELFSVYSRTAHMQEFNCISGMEVGEEHAWNLKADALHRAFAHEPQTRQREFVRVVKISGLRERQLTDTGRIDLDRLIKLRASDDLLIFRSWLRSSESKTDAEIRDRVSSLKSKLGNFMADTFAGKALRIVLTNLPGTIPNPVISSPLGIGLSALDSFLWERLLPRDAVLGVLVKEYPAICKIEK